ncbi:hypothetical protein, partial [Roseovarius marisflavi]|uniref:hypothetical protein n=1 Tax=Roseovarius marisflavi TaxID=1054996 RepID=UPI001C65B08D
GISFSQMRIAAREQRHDMPPLRGHHQLLAISPIPVAGFFLAFCEFFTLYIHRFRRLLSGKPKTCP